MSYKKILISVDNRENSINVAKKGFELAEQLNAEVALIFVVESSVLMANSGILNSDMGSPGMRNPDIGTILKDELVIMKKNAENSLDEIIRVNNSKKTTKFMPEGFAREAILETAQTWGADLIVIGLHGKTGLGIFVMGSISQYISLHSKIPVMIIPSLEK